MILVICIIVISFVQCQNPGKQKVEFHPKFTIQKCTTGNHCTDESGELTLDANWRWTHKLGGYVNCFDGKWDKTLCPDPETCTKNCAIDGVPESDWTGTYGIHVDGSSAKLNFVTKGNVGSRIYYLEDSKTYKLWKLVNQEFTFDVDLSQIGCGINGALYFTEMAADGGMSKYPTNLAGAKFGVGYCDAQCPSDIKWISGLANTKDWKNGTGYYGSCCMEMDIWEANKYATAYTPHPCDTTTGGQTQCEMTKCGPTADGGHCDKAGCDLNAFRCGNHSFFGPGSNYTIDTTKKFTIVTQFLSSSGTNDGDLSEIKRLYIQNDKIIPQAMTNIPGVTKDFNSLTDENCAVQKKADDEDSAFAKQGGMKQMGMSLKRGMVLVMSLWDDYAAHMLWLDSAYPVGAPIEKPGVLRGPCPKTSGVPADVEKEQVNAYVIYSNVRYGDIGSTYHHGQKHY